MLTEIKIYLDCDVKYLYVKEFTLVYFPRIAAYCFYGQEVHCLNMTSAVYR